MSRSVPVAPVPLLLDVRQLAATLNRSIPSLRRDDAAGRIPEAVRIGSSKKWRRDEVTAWVAAGCPIRSVWSTTYPANRRKDQPPTPRD